MPLHLLGKKSWNVYNTDNIERVRRDEAEAKKREEEREAKEREDEADKRLRILKGEPEAEEEDPVSQLQHSELASAARPRPPQKRKLPGEDDTDRDIRLARATQSVSTAVPSHKPKRPDNEASIVDAKGNISLVPVPDTDRTKKPRLDSERDIPGTVYLSHASGRNKDAGDKPWYNKPSTAEDVPQSAAWGEENPRRRQREAARLSANDPLAAMKKGVRQLREAERHRKEWMEQRERDLKEVEELARVEERRRRRRTRGGRTRDEDDGEGGRRGRGDDEDLESLDGFDLDEGYTKSRSPGRSHSRSHRRPHGHGHRHHHRHRHRENDNDNDHHSRESVPDGKKRSPSNHADGDPDTQNGHGRSHHRRKEGRRDSSHRRRSRSR